MTENAEQLKFIKNNLIKIKIIDYFFSGKNIGQILIAKSEITPSLYTSNLTLEKRSDIRQMS